MLVSLVWAALFFMAGLHWFWVLGLGGVGAVGGFAAFKLSPHVHERVLRFIDPDSVGGMVDTFQVDTALQSILSGGWLGRGPGEGVYKRILPDAHTDFVFAVTGEEFGMIACLALIAFFGFIVIRGLWLALRNQDPFCRFAAAGLTLMFGVQSWINMAVNLRAIPAKGMTLPFISYGGSSLARARPRHGLSRRADAQAAARGSRREAVERARERAALHSRRGRRHGRTPFSRRRARGGAGAARRERRTRHRRSRAEVRRRFSRPRDPRHSLGDDDRRRGLQQGARGAGARGGPRLGAVAARAGSSPAPSSASAAIPPCRR